MLNMLLSHTGNSLGPKSGHNIRGPVCRLWDYYYRHVADVKLHYLLLKYNKTQLALRRGGRIVEHYFSYLWCPCKHVSVNCTSTTTLHDVFNSKCPTVMHLWYFIVADFKLGRSSGQHRLYGPLCSQCPTPAHPLWPQCDLKITGRLLLRCEISSSETQLEWCPQEWLWVFLSKT